MGGHGRSGSTLLGVLLGGHPRMLGLGEFHRLSLGGDDGRCADGRLPEDHDFWSPVITAVCASRGVPPEVWRQHLATSRPRAGGLGRRMVDAELLVAAPPTAGTVRRLPPLAGYLSEVRNSLAFLDEACRQAGADWGVDVTKNPARLKALWVERPQQVRVVHLVRDGRAVAASNRRRVGTPVEESMRRWAAENAKVEATLATLPRTRHRRIRYEDLCVDPPGVLADLAGWLGLDFHDGMVDPPPARRVQISGNEWLSRAPDEPVRIHLDDAWRSSWGAREEATARACAWRGLRRYGYLPGGDGPCR